MRMATRRAVLGFGVAGALSTRLPAKAQAKRMPIVAVLHPGSPPPISSRLFVAPFEESLAKIGYTVGQSIALEYRFAGGKPDLLPALALELASLRPDAVIAVGTPSIAAARALPVVLPIIAVDFQVDPVASGLLASYSHPGGNVTGLFLDLPQITGKWLQLITESVSNVRRIAVMWDVTTGTYQIEALSRVAHQHSIDLDILKLKEARDFDGLRSLMLKQRPQALIQFTSPVISLLTRQVALFALDNRLPAISPYPTFPEAGGLMSYGPDLAHLYSRLGPLVDRIVKGSKPAEISAEGPSKFELVVHIGTARALNIGVPNSIRMTADRIIE